MSFLPRSVVRSILFSCLVLLACSSSAPAAGRYLEITYPPSDKAGELQLGVTYTLWIPEGVATIRGIIVHQHGCGSGACKAGATAAYDLHWQALAKKWDCALLGPSYLQDDKQNCRLWCDPRNGSRKTFLKALGEFASQAKHPEIETAPWCLWGHSGGGFWASLMQMSDPDRIVGIWFRSGTAFATWEKGDIARPDIPAAAYAIPMMCNPGAKEKGDKRFDGAWTGSMAMFKAYRAKGAPIGFAPDPRTSHECGDSRYLAIPFFDACLAMRLPAKDAKALRPIDRKASWLATLLSDAAEPAAKFAGKVEESVWLPDERVAKAWSEYVKIGAVSDATPPPAPMQVKASVNKDQSVEVTWDAAADFESGIKMFIIQRDSKDIGQVPEKAVGKFGRPLFQSMSYHDTPEKPMPAMRFTDRTAKPGVVHEYRIIAVNSVDLKSAPAKATVKAAAPTKEERLAKAQADLGSSDVEVRRTAIRALVHSDLSDALGEAMQKALTDSDAEVRATAATAVGNLGAASVSALPALVKQMQSDASKEARETAARALGRIGKAAPKERDAVAPLRLTAGKDADPVTRVVALGALAMMEIDVPDQVVALRKFLHHDASLVRMKASHALGMMGLPAKSAAPEIVAVLERCTDPHERGYIARALGNVGDPASLPALYKALERETDAGSRGELRGAISRLGGRLPMK
jgi:HEAT repeat protein